MQETEQEHWRQRLLELKGALEAKQTTMAKDMDVDASYFSRLLYPPGKKGRKNLGLDTMRAAVKAYGLQADWFDLPLGSALPKRMPGPAPVASNVRLIAEEPEPREPNGTRLIWPFKAAGYQRLLALQAALGPATAAEALRDLDSLLEAGIIRWENKVAQQRKLAS